MKKYEVTESISVKVNSTEEEITQVIIGGAIVPYIRLVERYDRAKKNYEDSGYTIKNEDLDNFSFTAEKKYIEERE